MSAGVVSGRPLNRVPSGMEAMRWFQTPRDCRARPDETGVRVHVSHFPPGTSKWNKIEHRLFCHITHNWRGKPLRTFETIVDLIGNTRADAGLRVNAELDTGKYPKGVTATDEQMKTLSLHRDEFRGDWSYELRPR